MVILLLNKVLDGEVASPKLETRLYDSQLCYSLSREKKNVSSGFFLLIVAKQGNLVKTEGSIRY